MIVIGIIGAKAAGKDTIARHIAAKYKGNAHAHSEVLEQILRILKLPITRDNAIKLVALRKNFGENVLANALNKRIKNDNSEIEILTGVRFDSELQNIRSYPHNALIYIDAPIETRYLWQTQRKIRSDDSTMSYEEFVKIEKRETEIHIQELGAQADYTIINEGSLDELYAKVDDIMQEILKTA